MDGNGNMNYRNWGFYEAPGAISGHLGLQLMSGSHDKPLNAGRSHPTMINTGTIGPYHHMPTNNGFLHHRVSGLSESPMPSDFVRDSWINSREKYFNGLPSSHHQQHHHHPSSFSLLPESSGVQEMQMLNLTDSPDDEEGVTQLDEVDIERDFSGKKRPGGKNQKSPKSKKSKKGLKDDGSVTRARAPKKSVEIMINGIDMDISSIPIPVCTCTGASQQCYRWGSGGWQSACCTTGMSIYPLPMSAKRRGARIAGRKMSIGAFKKVLEKLVSEGYNFSRPIDLKTHWAKHGTNKFVTIR